MVTMCFNWFKKKETISPPMMEIDMDGTELRTRLKSDFPKAAIFVSDKKYKTTTISDVRRFLANDPTDKNWFTDEYMDCDDFSFSLHGSISSESGWSALPFGIVYAQKGKLQHAMNIFIDKDYRIWLIEPQNDTAKIYDGVWKIRFILI